MIELRKDPSPVISGAIELHPEYKVIVQSNKLAVDVDNEMAVLHKVIIFSLLFRLLSSFF